MGSVLTNARLVGNHMGWFFLVTLYYEGEPFDYMYEMGDLRLTEREAQDVVKSEQCMLRAQVSFLRDVDLKTKH